MRPPGPMLLIAPVVLGLAVPGLAQNSCDAGKLKCMRSKVGCLLKVHEKAVKTGLAPDAVRIALCQSKFDDPVKGCIAKLEAKQDPAKPATVCSIVGNAAFLEATVDGCVADAVAGVGSVGGPSTCDSGKLKCMRNKAGCLLKVDENAIKTGTAPDAAKIALCRLKFDDPVKGCLAKLEAKQNVANPATLCTATGDTAALEAIVDACVTDAVDELTTCPAFAATGAQFLHQDVADVEDVAESNDRFGSPGPLGLFDSPKTGDFDGDGFDDLVVFVPGEHGIGAMAILYGAPTGLFGTSRDILTGTTGLCDGPRPVAVGDFDGDGRDDVVAIQGICLDSPCDCVPGLFVGEGFFYPIYIQAAIGGDFNGDEYDDLLAIVPWEEGGPLPGSLSPRRLLVPGGPSGLSDLSDPSNTEIARFFDDDLHFVTRMVKGDFDDDPIDDVVEAYPGGHLSIGGGVRLLRNGSNFGTIWTQDSAGIVGGSESSDQFGLSLAVGDFNGDGLDDLAVGVPGEDATFENQGAFQRIFGNGSGLTATNNQLFGAITPQAQAQYGTALAAGNFDNADAADELVVGAPYHDVDGFSDAGYVDIRFGNATTTQWWQGAATGIPGTTESGDRFGEWLAVGDFNGDGADDLAISVPGEDIGTATDAGAVNVLYGTPSQCLPAGRRD